MNGKEQVVAICFDLSLCLGKKYIFWCRPHLLSFSLYSFTPRHSNKNATKEKEKKKSKKLFSLPKHSTKKWINIKYIYSHRKASYKNIWWCSISHFPPLPPSSSRSKAKIDPLFVCTNLKAIYIPCLTLCSASFLLIERNGIIRWTLCLCYFIAIFSLKCFIVHTSLKKRTRWECSRTVS